MERQIRRVAIGFLILFAALAVNVNYIQVIAADRLANNNANKRLLIDEYDVDRGRIVAADRQTVLARSRATEGELKYLRRYPTDPALGYGHITGFYSLIFGRTELEQSFNQYLSGRADELFPQRLVDEILGEDRRGAGLVLSLEPELQEVAAEALGNREGAVAAIDPQSGDVLALVSNPTYNPNPLSSHDPRQIRDTWAGLDPESPTSPLVSRATDLFFPPGSIFKVVTAAAALEDGLGPDHLLPNPPSLEVPQTTRRLNNFGGGQCSGGSEITMAEAMRQSCNVYFAQLGMEIGADVLIGQAHEFGFSEDIPFDIPFVEGEIPPASAFEDDIPALAQSSIGQRDVRTNVLHMSLIAGAIGNGGQMMRPRLVTEIRDPEGRGVLRSFGPEGYSRPMTPRNAGALTEMMIEVVQAGTATGAQIPGITVAGKTGTAQTADGAPPHAWFISFAPAEDPEIAVAVVVLNGGDLGNEATGGQLSAPIARAVMEAALNRR